MLASNEVEYLCRVGPGTPMGAVLRRYWIPAFPATDLPSPDGPPIRVSLLGESFVAFRDTNGRLGLLDELCCHRGASLSLGRVEDCGIRCLYHGWKFAVDGTILETPNLPDSRFKERVKAPSYPLREAGGLAWAYLGPPEKEPAFPDYPWFHVPSSQIAVREVVMKCNWVQVAEGSIDSSHVSVLHGGMSIGRRPRVANPEIAERLSSSGRPLKYGGWSGQPIAGGLPPDDFPSEDLGPRLEVENTDFGFHYAAVRSTIYGEDRRYVRITPYIFPFMTYIPPSSYNNVVITTPLDDEHTAFIGAFVVEGGREDSDLMRRRTGPDQREFAPNRADRYIDIPAQDRQAMAERRSFSGIEGIRMQDAAVQMSMGRIYDRKLEHLVPADVSVIRLRRLLVDSARAVAAGEDPVGLGSPVDTMRIEAASGVIPADLPWQALVPGNRGHQPAGARP